MIGFNNLVKPYYAPKLFIEEVEGKQILVIWVIAGNERPYEVPEIITAKNKIWKYFIRKYASSIEAKGAETSTVGSHKRRCINFVSSMSGLKEVQ